MTFLSPLMLVGAAAVSIPHRAALLLQGPVQAAAVGRR